MAGRGWVAPPPLPSYENVWSQGSDMPPSYEEALLGGTQAQAFQAPSLQLPYPVSSPGENPLYPPVPPYSATPAAAPSASPAAPRRDTVEVQRVVSNEELMAWWRSVKSWGSTSHSPDIEPRLLAKKVHRVQRAMKVYGILIKSHVPKLQSYIAEFQHTADSASRAYHSQKGSGLSSGTTRAVGSAAAVTGIVLAPFTMGASLAMTAMGVGVVAAGGISSATLRHKVVVNLDRRAMERALQDYRKKSEELEACLQYIYAGLEQLGRNNLSILKGANMDAGKAARMLELSGKVAEGLGATSRTSDLLRGFSSGLCSFYSKKDCHLLKRGMEKKFAKSLNKVTGRLECSLDELSGLTESFSRH